MHYSDIAPIHLWMCKDCLLAKAKEERGELVGLFGLSILCMIAISIGFFMDIRWLFYGGLFFLAVSVIGSISPLYYLARPVNIDSDIERIYKAAYCDDIFTNTSMEAESMEKLNTKFKKDIDSVVSKRRPEMDWWTPTMFKSLQKKNK